MEQAMTVGEMVDKYGPCDLMVLVAELAEKRGHIPVGLWDVDGLPDGWRVLVNGTKDVHESVQPWHVLIERHGLPLALFNSADGTVLHNAEPDIVAMLKAALATSARP